MRASRAANDIVRHAGHAPFVLPGHDDPGGPNLARINPRMKLSR
jgi:hypothetical protein